jgi:hypothetical protein
MALFDNHAQDTGVFSFGIDETAKGYMLETARWAKFLAIVGFVAIGLLGLLALVAIFSSAITGSLDSQYGSFSGRGIQALLFALMAIFYFFPTYFLFRFSTLIKPALLSFDQHGFNKALSHLRNAFRFIGVLMLIVLGLYAMVFIIFILGAAFA